MQLLSIGGNSKRFALSTASLIVALVYAPPQMVPAALAQYQQSDSAPTSGSVVTLNNDGVRALTSSNFKLAIEKFEAALKIDGTYKLARSNLAIAYNNYGLQLRNDPKQAIKMFHKALMLDPANATTRQNVDGIIRMMGKDPKDFEDRVDLGDQARKGGDFTGAIVEYAAALDLKDDAGVHEKLGDVYRVVDRVDKAIEQYQAGIRAKDSAGLEVKLAQAFLQKKDIASGIAALGQALKLNSDDPEVKEALVTAWEQALQVDPTSPANHIGLGQALMMRGDFDQAEQEFQQAIRFSPGKNNAIAQKFLKDIPAAKKAAEVEKHINAGLELQKTGNLKGAIEEYNAALAGDPNDDAIWVNIGTAYQAMKDYANALKAYQQANKINPQNQDAIQGIKTASAQQKDATIKALAEAANTSFKSGDFAGAVDKYLKLLEFNPKDAATHFNLGAAYERMKNIDAALNEYSMASKLDPDNKDYQDAYKDALGSKAQPLINQALAAHKAKDYPTAIKLYQGALAMQPNNDELLYNLASAQYSAQLYKDAAVSYSAALKIDPKGRGECIYFLATIDENYGNGVEALAKYKLYLQKVPTGMFVAQANARVKALSLDVTKTVQIKSETQLAKEAEAAEAFKQGVALQEGKQYAQAEPLYKKAMALVPDNVDYIYNLGTLYQVMQKYDLAGQLYAQAKKLSPDAKYIDEAIASLGGDQAQPIVDDAVKKQQAGDLAGAIAGYQKALTLIPGNARVWTNLGTAQQQMEQWIDAAKSYQKAYELDAKGEVANLYFLGILDENAGNGVEALSKYKHYLQKDPVGTYVKDANDRVARLMANVKDTVKIVTKAEAANAATADEAYQNGIKLQEAQKYDEAIAQYAKAETAMPGEPAYPYAKGTALQAKGDLEGAAASYDKAISLSKDQKFIADVNAAKATLGAQKVAPILEKANADYQAKNYAAAAAGYAQVVKMTPNDGDSWIFLAASYQFEGNYQAARGAYDSAYKLGKKPDALYFLGALDENDGQAAMAISHYQQYIKEAPNGEYKQAAQQRIDALRKNPADVQKMQTVAQAAASAEVAAAYQKAVELQTASKFPEALAEYDKAIAGAPNEPSYIYGKGTAYQASGDLDNAIKCYEKAVSLNGSEKAYRDALNGAKAAKAQPLVDSAIKKQTTDLGGGKYDLPGAIADYNAALKLYDDPATHMNLGTALQANNDNAGALREYTRAIQLDASMADAYFYRAALYEFMGNKAAAKADYTKYLQLAPSGPNAGAAREGLKRVSGPAAPGKRK